MKEHSSSPGLITNQSQSTNQSLTGLLAPYNVVITPEPGRFKDVEKEKKYLKESMLNSEAFK